MLRVVIISLLLISIILFTTTRLNAKVTTQDISKLENYNEGQKPVVVLIVDSLMDKPLQKALTEGKVPTLSYLKAHGQYYPNLVSSYPTMSVSIDSTLLTGTYPEIHKLPGLVWYDEEEQRLINYGSGTKEVLKVGIKKVLYDSLYNLNNKHLSKDVKTVFEDLNESNLSTASINGLIYRGNDQHSLTIPKMASFFNLLPKQLQTNGPSILSFGRLSQINPSNSKNNYIWKNLGVNDEFSALELTHLINNDKLPSFSIVYFPNLDHDVHKKGPNIIEGIEKVDRQLQQIVEAFPSPEKAIENVTWIVLGDSAQSTIMNDNEKAIIDLRKVFNNYQIAKLGKPVAKSDQLVFAVNERMAYVYSLDDQVSLQDISKQLMKDDRVDFISYIEEDHILVHSVDKDSQLTFRPNGKMIDQYDQAWTINGDYSILDIKSENGIVTYGDYPDALARIYGSLHSHNGRYIITDAKPGFEFIGEKSPTHIGGAGHGSLHKVDSLSPLLITGTKKKPANIRMIDLKSFILELTTKKE